jgi:MscS family membrane protein
VLFAVAALVVVADPSPCASPRAAAATIASNLRDERLDLRKASRCVEDGGLARSEREKALQTLKQALDATGARVRIEELSEASDYVDPKTLEPVIPLTRELPRVRLERLENGEWMIPRSVIAQADKIYDDAVAVDLVKLKRSFPSWAQRAMFGVAAWQALALLALLLVGAAVRALIVRLALWKAPLPLARLGVNTTSADIAGAARPLGSLAMAGIVAAFAPSLAFGATASAALLLFVRIAAALAALGFCYSVVDVVADQLVKRAAHTTSKMDDHLVPLVRRSLKIIVIALAVVVVLQQFDMWDRSSPASASAGSRSRWPRRTRSETSSAASQFFWIGRFRSATG